MPGYLLSFKCSCGFRKDGVRVGATQTGHFRVLLCLQCKKLFSIWISPSQSGQNQDRKICKKCRMELMAITDPGAWGPSSVQEKFIDWEPWLVDYQVAEDIRVLCPKCKMYSLKYEAVALWD